MKRFSFRLDNILNYRIYLEKKAQRDLSLARKKCLETEGLIKSLMETRQKVAKECSHEGSVGMGVTRYQLYQSFLNRLDHDLVEAFTQLKEGEEKLKEREVILKKESIQKKTLESLKDMEKKRYMARIKKEEQKIMDERAVIRGGRSI